MAALGVGATSADSSWVRARRRGGMLLDPQRTARAPPSDARHPGGWRRRRRRRRRRRMRVGDRGRALPAQEVRPGAARVDARWRPEVLAEVERARRPCWSASGAAWSEGAHDSGRRRPGPLRPRARLTASANRIASPWIPPRATGLVPSTMKWPWSCWIEKWITRNRSTEARAMVFRSAPNRRGERSEGSPGVARMVTCIGYRGSTFGRISWGIEGRPRGFRPAPLRAPPQVRGAPSGSLS